MCAKLQKVHFLKETLRVNKNSSLYLPSLNGITGTAADVVELVDMLDLGFNLRKSVKIFKMRMWWNW